MRRPQIFFSAGFLFGTLGLFILAGLSLVSRFVEAVVAPLLFPGRFLAQHAMGAEGSTLDIILLTLFNGILYALMALAIERITRAFV